MTKQESFKRRVRERMLHRGERYAVARAALIGKSANDRNRRRWVSPPDVADQTVRSSTGRGWDDWCDVIEGWPGHNDGHGAIAVFLGEEHGLDGWWSQSVTVGYERITGLRLPYQRPDGTFTAGKSMTVDAEAGDLRALLLDDDARVDLFPGKTTRLRSKPTVKAIRIEIGPGVASLSLDPRDDGRTKVAVSHEKLPTFDDVAEWRFYWDEWLGALDQG